MCGPPPRDGPDRDYRGPPDRPRDDRRGSPPGRRDDQDADRRGDGFRDDRRGPPRDDGYRDDRRDRRRDDDREGPAARGDGYRDDRGYDRDRDRGYRPSPRSAPKAAGPRTRRAASATTAAAPLVRRMTPVTWPSAAAGAARRRRLGQEGRRRALRPRTSAEAGCCGRRPARRGVLRARPPRGGFGIRRRERRRAAMPRLDRNNDRFTRPPSIGHGHGRVSIPPVRRLALQVRRRPSSDRPPLLCEWRVAISRRLFGRRPREGGGFSVASAMASCSAATQVLFPFGSEPSKSGTPAMPNNRSPSLSTLLTHCTSCRYMSSCCR